MTIKTLPLLLLLPLALACPPDPDPDPTPDPTPEPERCDPDDHEALPVQFERIDGVVSAEDFALAPDGGLFSIDESGNFIRNPPGGGSPQVISPNLTDESAGITWMPDGKVVVADVARGALLLVDPETGGSSPILSGLSYPNGVEVHRDGWVAVAEQDAGQVRRVDPETGDFVILATGLYAPNGVTFSPDWETLYVGSFGGGTVHAVPLDEDGAAGPAVEYASTGDGWEGDDDDWDEDDWEDWEDGIGAGGLDGIAVDACGYVYVTVFENGGDGNILRVTEQGADFEVVANLPVGWVPNMEFGHGEGGYDARTLYVNTRDRDSIFALSIGALGRPRADAGR